MDEPKPDSGPKLIIEVDDGRRREHALESINTIGRHPLQTIQILDPQVSKAHLIIEVTPEEGWIVEDLGSLNGTTVNDKPLKGSRPLKHLDRVRVGSCTMVFWKPQKTHSNVHTVTIGDGVESNIRESVDHKTSQEFLPAAQIEDDAVLRRDYEKLRLAATLHDEIALELRLENLLPRILDLLLKLFDTERGVILLADENTGKLVSRAVKTQLAKGGHQEIKLSKTMLAQVVSEHQAVLTNDAQHDSRFSGADSVIISGIRSSMCAPLLARDQTVLGVIHLDSIYRPGQFTERDLNVLQGVANQAAVAIENARLVERIERDAVTRQNFEKMFSPNLVERILEGGLRIEKGGVLKPVTVMFTDIRGFTELTQSVPAQDVVALLNEYFEVLVDVVFDFDGTVDKFIGDSLMALWGVPVDCEGPEGVRAAVDAAVAIQHAMQRFNAHRRAEGLGEIQTGIGIDTGEIVAGYMGSSKTMSYTVVGDSVNLASRLCAIAGGNEILISEAARAALGEDLGVDSQGSVQLKGFERPVPTWRVTDTWSEKQRPITDTSQRLAAAGNTFVKPKTEP